MAGQGFDPDFIFTWPTGRMGVMEGESAVMALFSAELERLEREDRKPSPELEREMASVRAEYDRQLDARFAAARGFVDAIITPEGTRAALELALRTALNNPGSHLGPVVLPTCLDHANGNC
jgi:acetyl-CoA carboxylase carboxyltransferase component